LHCVDDAPPILERVASTNTATDVEDARASIADRSRETLA
jgi:hypothetical protein